MKIYTDIIDAKKFPDLRNTIHNLRDQGHADTIRLKSSDLCRRRFTCETELGKKVGISLPRRLKLFDGAALEVTKNYSLSISVEPEDWISLRASNPGNALKLGYFCGNLHWTVRFDGEILKIAIADNLDTYLDRIENVFTKKEIEILDKPERLECQ